MGASMQCPKCQAALEAVPTSAGVVDRCTHCKGLWFDSLEYEDLEPHAAMIDTGDAALGAAHNAIDRIDCPVCPNSRMLRMVDPGQPHIWFESCPTCHGRFYDAGEFVDFAERGFGDWLESLRAKARD
jgi:Zn-finger nucleic acid-binding protein